MIEEHYYESSLAMGNCRYDVANVKSALLEYFQDNAKPVFPHLLNADGNQWVFHKKGISILMQTTAINDDELHFVDVKLVSDTTPTLGLEKHIRSIIDNYRL